MMKEGQNLNNIFRILILNLTIPVFLVACNDTANVSSYDYYDVDKVEESIVNNEISSTVNDLTTESNTYNVSHDVYVETKPQTEEPQFDVSEDFYIEGKWKSVGSEGFGQAQPGAIVVFDGNHCNFFSPQDTYAFYKDGERYILDCTSFMSTDTVTFNVTISDNDNIEVDYGDLATVLKRVQ